jgi:hypothetical protein
MNIANKAMAITIAMILTFSMTSMTLIPTTKAHIPPWEIPTQA